MRTKRQQDITSPSLLHLLGWSLLDVQERTAEEARLMHRLRTSGIAEDHADGLRSLEVLSCLAVIDDLTDEKMRPRLLHAIKVLGQAQSREARRLRVTKEALYCMADLLPFAKTISFDTQVQLVKGWLSNSGDTGHFEDLVKWCSSNTSDLPKQAGWRAIVKKRIASARWASPLQHASHIGKVRVQTLTSGDQLLKEGKTMGHCLATPMHAHEHLLGCLDQNTQIFHLDLEKNPLICATLAIRLHKGSYWRIADFETVGRGEAPQCLQDAAQNIIELINKQFGFVADDIEEFEDDEDDDGDEEYF